MGRPVSWDRVPITSRAGTDGGGLRTILLAFAVLIACGLLYAYLTRPDLFAQPRVLPDDVPALFRIGCEVEGPRE